MATHSSGGSAKVQAHRGRAAAIGRRCDERRLWAGFMGSGEQTERRTRGGEKTERAMGNRRGGAGICALRCHRLFAQREVGRVLKPVASRSATGRCSHVGRLSTAENVAARTLFRTEGEGLDTSTRKQPAASTDTNRRWGVGRRGRRGKTSFER